MNGRGPKIPPLPVAATTGPTDAEGRLRRAIVTAIGRAKRPLAMGELWSAVEVEGTGLIRTVLDALVADGLLVQVDRDGWAYWDLAGGDTDD